MNVPTKMTMTYELLTPDMAANLLVTNRENRTLAKDLANVYAKDIMDGNWDEETGDAISIDVNGVLRNGQHRCLAVIKAGKPIKTWVCRNVSATGIYDYNRKRSLKDQIVIMRRDLAEAHIRQTRTQAMIRTLIQCESFSKRNTTVSPKQIIDYIDDHKDTLDGFLGHMPTKTVPRISITVVFLALYLAYLGGVPIETIESFYDVLASGMSGSPIDFPIISYRNYLLSLNVAADTSDKEISRCQYALSKYMNKACTKTTKAPSALKWDYPKKKEA